MSSFDFWQDLQPEHMPLDMGTLRPASSGFSHLLTVVRFKDTTMKDIKYYWVLAFCARYETEVV